MRTNGCSIPFFVVDRPMSLKLLEFCEIDKLPFKIGLMGHANTSDNFQRLFREFNGKNIIKMVDSGVFSKEGCKFSYEDLFKIYERMGADFGIMIDVLKNKDETLNSAKEATKVYYSGNYNFELVGVAQGNTPEEYLECYQRLREELGFRYIGIGGLLKKVENSSRYVRVKDEKFLETVIRRIRESYPHDWLFLLGCYHPKRIPLFRKYRIFGSDYKGWILNYTPPQKNEKRKFSRDELRIKRFKQVRDYLYDKVFASYLNRKLIIVSCSKKKKSVNREIPAIELYDGPQFKLLRKYLDLPNLDIYIISAKYGLIESSEYIGFYDMKMTTKRAEELKESIVQTLSSVLEQNYYSEILINLGKNYLQALDGFRGRCNHNCRVVIVEGRIGERLSEMKKWLESLTYCVCE